MMSIINMSILDSDDSLTCDCVMLSTAALQVPACDDVARASPAHWSLLPSLPRRHCIRASRLCHHQGPCYSLLG